MEKQVSIKQQLTTDRFKEEIAKTGLPDWITPDRMVRIALTAINKTPGLARCTPESFFRCMMELGWLGLEPDNRMAYLIPYGNECTLIVSYKGLVQILFRSPRVKKINADIVRSGDLFEYDNGEVIRHVPWFLRQDNDKPDDRGDIIASYCVVSLDEGYQQTVLIERCDLNAIKNRSRSGKNGPWVTDFGEMARKTAFRRAVKYLPMPPAVAEAVARANDASEPPSRDAGRQVAAEGPDLNVIEAMLDPVDAESTTATTSPAEPES